MPFVRLKLATPFLLLALQPSPGAAHDVAHPASELSVCASDQSTIKAWPEANLKQWDTREFAGASEYRLVELDGIRVLDARTDGKASVLYREQEIDLTKTPVLGWSWRVNSVYDNDNEQSKSGDDFPARLYVVVQTGFLPWQTHGINYVFASSIPEGSEWLNPYTDKAKMIALQSGEAAAGRWHCEERNVAEDFSRAFPDVFPTPPKRLSGYAVMVDGDNGGFAGNAQFGGLYFEPG